MSQYRIGVIYGSRSTEHEVSVVTALQVMKALEKNHQVIPIYISKEGKWLTGDILKDPATYKKPFLNDKSLSTLVITPDVEVQAIQNPLKKNILTNLKKIDLDLVYPAVHGLHGEDGTLQGLCELANIPYMGSDTSSSALCIDKILTKYVLKGAGLPVLDFYWFTREQWEEDEEKVITDIEKKFGYPVVVKPARLGSSIGISLSKNNEELKYNISVASHLDTRILIESFLSPNQEINCSVLGYHKARASVCEQPVTTGEFLSYEDKYLKKPDQGFEGTKRIIPAPISKEMAEKIQQLALNVFSTIGARGVIRVDFLIDKKTNEVFVNEINTLPGSLSFYLWEPMNVSKQDLLEELIDIAFMAFREKNKTKFTTESLLLDQVDLNGIKK